MDRARCQSLEFSRFGPAVRLRKAGKQKDVGGFDSPFS